MSAAPTPAGGAALDAAEAALDRLFEAVFATYHHDFRRYSRSSMRRRVAHAVERLAVGSVDALAARVADDAALFARLLPFLTIQVSDMFRDPDFFLAFRREVVPVLRTYPSHRLWVAGCATGEEAYALAIIMREEGLGDRCQIYATDIHADSLAIGAEGVYPLDRVQAFTANHQRTAPPDSLVRHYTAAYGAARFDRSLREMILFADHSLATDAVFAEVHVVTCRNVLIYFDRALQDRALGLFHQALCPGGFLGLGPRESLRFSGQRDGFVPFAEPERWFRRRPVGSAR